MTLQLVDMTNAGIDDYTTTTTTTIQEQTFDLKIDLEND